MLRIPNVGGTESWTDILKGFPFLGNATNISPDSDGQDKHLTKQHLLLLMSLNLLMPVVKSKCR